MSRTLDRYAVCGNPVAHSLSPKIHALFADATDQNMRYDRILVPNGDFKPTVEHFFTSSGCGLNVTLPCKEEAFMWLGEARCSAQATQARAVNTIRREGSEFQGFNTDGIGLVRDLRYYLIEIARQRILILGAGGAVRGVLPELIAAGPSMIVVGNRTLSRAEELVSEFAEGTSIDIQAIDLPALTPDFDLVINATSAAFSSGTRPDLDESVVRDADCYDMVYGQNARFHHWARTITSRRSFDGLGMLIEQAAESFWLWRGIRPPTQLVRTTLTAE